MNRWIFIIGLVLFSSSAMANGNLYTLIVELENLKGLVAQQETKAVDNGGRWVFRYDILQKRIDDMISDINKHIDVVSQTPRLERF